MCALVTGVQTCALPILPSGAAPLGIVYATDARASKAVRVVGVFPASSHPPIRYPVALLRTSRHKDAAAFRAFLFSKQGRAIFARHGFSEIGRASCRESVCPYV